MNRQAFFQRLARVFRVDSYVCFLTLVMLLLVGGLLVGPSTRKAKASTLAGAVWAPLGFGLNNFVTAIGVSGNDVYVGGSFTAICGNAACNNGNVAINHIAKWDGTRWTSLGFGLNAQPYSIVINGSKVYVAGPTMICGDAACSTGTTVQGLAVWDGGGWSAPFPPLVSNTGCCYTLAFLGNNLYAGGLGKIAYPPENEDISIGIAELSGGTWTTPVPDEGLIHNWNPNAPSFSGYPDTRVGSLLAIGNDLYVGGSFNKTYPDSSSSPDSAVINLNNIAVLRGGAVWQPLPGKGLVAANVICDQPGGTCGGPNSFAAIGTDLYVGGSFTQTYDGSISLTNIAKFDTFAHTWSALPNNGLNGPVGSRGLSIPGGLATRGNDLFAVGGFTATADNAVTGLNGIAWLSNGAWSILGNGFVGGSSSSGPALFAIAASTDNLYVGGFFSQNGDGTAPGMNNIARLAPVITTKLEINKTASPNPVTVGQNLTYTITIKNDGPDIANAVTLTDPLPANVTFVSAASTQGSCSKNSGPVICNVGTMAAAAVTTVTIVVTPNATGNVANAATVSAANAQDAQGQASSTVSPATTSLQFSSSSFSVNESGPDAPVTVTRTGDTSGSSTVDYATSDTAGSQNCNVTNGAASSRCDYLTTIGTLHFAAGVTSRTITIPIIDDSYAEGPETFTVKLSNPSGAGATLGSPATATVTINDNDSSNGVNPIDTAGFFVRQHYADFLNREPDSSGLNFWTNEITSCGSDAQCVQVKRVDVSAAFYLSIEFQETGYLVERIYKASYGDATGISTVGGTHSLPVPIIRLNEFLPDTQEIGQGVIVNQGNWQQQLENNKQAFTLEFVQRSRFTAAFSTSLTPAQFVDKLFVNAGVTPSATDRTTAINEFGSTTTTSDVAARSRALRDVAENSTLNQQELNQAFVLMQYLGYLRRNPNDPPDSDYTGYDFWLTKLNQFNGNFQNAEMVKAFISASEYRQRFGP